MPLFLLAALLAARFEFAVTAHAAENVASLSVETGRCVGRGEPEAPLSGGDLYDFHQDPQFHARMPDWELIGYKTDVKSGHLVGRDPVTKAFVAWMNEPEDFSQVRVDADSWGQLLTNGFRLDEETCVMRDSSGRALTRLGYQVEHKKMRLRLAHNALEILKVRLKGLDASAPIPAAVLQEMDALAQAGTKLPPEIQSLLSGSHARVKDINPRLEDAYRESTRFFDNQRSFKELALSILPVLGGLTDPKRKPSYVESAEQRLGRLFASDLEKKYSQTEIGRELLDHFRDKKGRVNLPPILLLKGVQSPDDPSSMEALYDPETGAMMLNHWESAQFLMAQAPPEERALRAKEFSDSRALGRYLETHPQERGKLLESLDGTFYHEFIHAWQGRRGRFDVESLRKNVPKADPIEMEHEAYREECRYIFAKSLADASALYRSGYADQCLGMLKDYDSFQDRINQLYMRTYAGSQSLPDVVKCQEERESMAHRLMSSGPVTQTLKLLGMYFHGNKALREEQSDYAQREQEFKKERLPGLLRRVAETLPDRYMAMNRPDFALRVLNNLPPDMPGLAALRDKTFPQITKFLIHPSPAFNRRARLAAYDAFKDLPWPVELYEAYCRDFVEERAFLKKQAEDTKDPALRAKLLKDAERWSSVLDELLAQVADLKKQAGTLKDPQLHAKYLKYMKQLSEFARQKAAGESR